MTGPLAPFDGHAIAPETQSFLREPHRLLIGGQWVDGSGELETRDPATGLTLARFAIGGLAEIDRAVATGYIHANAGYRRWTARKGWRGRDLERGPFHFTTT